MYDDWGNENGLADPAVLPPHDVAGWGSATSSIMFVRETDWNDDTADAEIFDDGAPTTLLYDDFIDFDDRPSSTLTTKAGSADDWLTPLSSNEAFLGYITVVGHRDLGSGAPGTGSSGGHETDPQNNPNLQQDPPCTADEMDWASPNGYDIPDGASYYAPESFNLTYLDGARNHLNTFDNTIGTASREMTFGGVTITIPITARMAEFEQMYVNREHPHFLDFKDIDAEPITYYSDALGRYIIASPYEAYGNFVYGLIGTMVGIDPNILRGAAWYLQEGSGTGAEDNPHVDLGIEAAKRYLEHGIPAVLLDERSCADG